MSDDVREAERLAVGNRLVERGVRARWGERHGYCEVPLCSTCAAWRALDRLLALHTLSAPSRLLATPSPVPSEERVAEAARLTVTLGGRYVRRDGRPAHAAMAEQWAGGRPTFSDGDRLWWKEDGTYLYAPEGEETRFDLVALAPEAPGEEERT